MALRGWEREGDASGSSACVTSGDGFFGDGEDFEESGGEVTADGHEAFVEDVVGAFEGFEDAFFEVGHVDLGPCAGDGDVEEAAVFVAFFGLCGLDGGGVDGGSDVFDAVAVVMEVDKAHGGFGKAAVDEDHVGFEAFAFVHGHDLDGGAFAF